MRMEGAILLGIAGDNSSAAPPGLREKKSANVKGLHSDVE